MQLGDQLAAYTGRYESISAIIDMTAEDGRLSAKISIKPEMLEALTEAGEEVPDQPPVILALLEGEGDRYVVDEGDAKGMKGYFARNDGGEISGVHFGGRLATRVS